MFTIFLKDGRIFNINNSEVTAYATLYQFSPTFYILDKQGEEIDYSAWSLPLGDTFIARTPHQLLKKLKELYGEVILSDEYSGFIPIYPESQNMIKILRKVSDVLDLNLIYPESNINKLL